MTYTFYGPADLRWVDPRPTPAPSKSDEDVVRDMFTAALSGDDLSRALQALGLEPYERTLNESGRDAWTRRTSKRYKAERERDARRQRECPRGHSRSVHSARDITGRIYCMTCKSADGEARRKAAAERRKQQAA